MNTPSRSPGLIRLPLTALSLGLWLCSSPAAAAVLWQGDFETGDLSQWDSTNLIKTGDRDNLVFVSDPVADGSKAAQITLRDDVIFEPYNQSRVEVKHHGLHTKNGEQSWYAWSFLVPADAEIRSNIGYWESRVTSKNTMTFWIEPGEGGTVVKFGTGDLGQTLRWTQKLELNVWHRVAIHNVWSQDQNVGKVDVWYDGTQVVTGATATKRDENELFFQMGLHRSDPSPPVQIIYLDAAVETDNQDELLKALPDPSGMGGAGGMGGSGGAASAAAAGNAGSAGTSGGASGSSGGAGAPATGGAPTAGSAGAGQPSGGIAPLVANDAATSDDGSCSFARPSARGAAAGLWALLALGCVARRRRR